MVRESKAETQARLRDEKKARDARMAKQKTDRLAAEAAKAEKDAKKNDDLEQAGKRVAALYKSMCEFEAAVEEKAGFELKKAAEKRAALEQALVEAREICKAAGKSFKAFQEQYAPDYKRTRLYQVLAIADGRKTVEGVREGARDRKRRQRASVRDKGDVTDGPAERTTLELPPNGGGPQPILMASAERPIEQVQAEFAALAGGEEVPPVAGDDGAEPPSNGHVAKPASGAAATNAKSSTKSSAVNAADIALEGFTTHVLDLMRRVAKHSAKRFAGTAVGGDELLKLGKFFTELGQLKSGETTSKPVVH
jgi:hypothetical protein